MAENIKTRYIAYELDVASGSNGFEVFATDPTKRQAPRIMDDSVCVKVPTSGYAEKYEVKRVDDDSPIRKISWMKLCVEDVSTKGQKVIGDEYTCARCGGTGCEYDKKNATLICTGCGSSTTFQDSTGQMWAHIWGGCGVKKGGHSTFTYRPQSHFSNWLARIQGKEPVTIPQHVVEETRQYLINYRIGLDDATVDDVRSFLKSKKDKAYSKWYPNCVTILRCISAKYNEKCPQLTEKQENDLCHMFADGLKAFRALRARGEVGGRRNMPSYTYMLLQLMTMLDIPNTAEFRSHALQLLRHEEKIVGLELLFEKISKEAGWDEADEAEEEGDSI